MQVKTSAMPLYISALKRHTQVVKLLLERRADLNVSIELGTKLSMLLSPMGKQK